MLKLWSTEYLRKVIAPDDILPKVAHLKSQAKTIATLNGSFDLLHAGHLQIIFEASQLANVLIVALNTDDSIKKYKDPQRPIIPLECRLQMLAALEFVDYVTWFAETDPCALLEKIQPDVHINGAEYGQLCIEADTVKAHGGTVYIVNLIPGLSTSQIVEKILAIETKHR